MRLRAVFETVNALRGMLRELKENPVLRDQYAIELQGILRQRIEDLEAGESSRSSN
jgi:hypothetical protein